MQRVLSVDLPPSQAFLQLDSKSRQKGEKITNMNLTKAGNYFSMSKPYMYALQYVSFHWHIPNVNPRNNKISWTDGSGTGTIYESTIPTGYYNLENFAPALETALNNGGFPSTFTVTIDALITGRTLTISCTGNFVPKSSGLDRSPWEMAGICLPQPSPNQVNTYTGIPELYYTRYVDIISDQMNRSQYITDESSNYPTSNVLVRVFGDDGSSGDDIIPESEWGTGGVITRPHKVVFSTDFPKWVSWSQPHANQALGATIDIRLVDEYGKELYVPDPFCYPNISLIFLTRSLE
jgi:hypothetical protein